MDSPENLTRPIRTNANGVLLTEEETEIRIEVVQAAGSRATENKEAEGGNRLGGLRHPRALAENDPTSRTDDEIRRPNESRNQDAPAIRVLTVLPRLLRQGDVPARIHRRPQAKLQPEVPPPVMAPAKKDDLEKARTPDSDLSKAIKLSKKLPSPKTRRQIPRHLVSVFRHLLTNRRTLSKLLPIAAPCEAGGNTKLIFRPRRRLCVCEFRLTVQCGEESI